VNRERIGDDRRGIGGTVDVNALAERRIGKENARLGQIFQKAAGSDRNVEWFPGPNILSGPVSTRTSIQSRCVKTIKSTKAFNRGRTVADTPLGQKCNSAWLINRILNFRLQALEKHLESAYCGL
jgi:hypothetical protein